MNHHVNGTLFLAAVALVLGILPLCVLANVRRAHLRPVEPAAAGTPPAEPGAWRHAAAAAGHAPTVRFPRHLVGDTRTRPISPPYLGSQR